MAKFTAQSFHSTYRESKTVLYFGISVIVPADTICIVTNSDGTVNALCKDAELGLGHRFSDEDDIMKWMFQFASITQIGVVSDKEAVNWQNSKKYID